MKLEENNILAILSIIHLQDICKQEVLLNQGCFFNTFEKTQGEKTSMFRPPSENSRAIFSKTLRLWDF